MYVNPGVIAAIRNAPAPAVAVAALPTIGIPAAKFPTLAVPPLHAPAHVAPLRLPAALHHPAPHAMSLGRTLHSVRVPVVTTSYSVVPPSAPKFAGGKLKVHDPFASVPVVTQSTGPPPPTLATPIVSDPAVTSDGVGASAVAPAADTPVTPDDSTAGLPQQATAAPAPATTDVYNDGPTTPTPTPTPTPAAWEVSLATDAASHTISVTTSGTDLTVTVDGVATTKALADVTSLSITGGAGGDAISVDVGALTLPISVDGGAGDDTLNGPAADSTWNITGAGAGSLGSTTFAGFEHLVGAAGNHDTFVVQGGSVASVDGGDAGYDTISVDGAGNVVSNPTGPSSGALVIDGTSVAYTGLEPVSISGTTSVTVSPGSTSPPIPAIPGDTVDVSQDTGGAHDIIVASHFASFETHNIALATLTNLNIDVFNTDAHDYVHFTSSITAPGLNLTVHAKQILVDSGITIDVTGGSADGTITFTAESNADGAIDVTNFATALDSGIVATLTAAVAALATASGYYQAPDAKITIDGSTLNGGDISLTATSTTNMDHSGPGLLGVFQVNVVNSKAEVAVVNGSSLVSSGTISLRAVSNITAVANSHPTSDPGSSDADAAFADNTVISNTRAHISGTSTFSSTGTTKVEAASTAVLTTSADASGRNFGGSFALAQLVETTLAYIDSSGTSHASALEVNSDAHNTVTTTAKASTGGASDNAGGSPADRSNSPQTGSGGGGNAKTGEGSSVSIAGALAFSYVGSDTQASIQAGDLTGSTIKVHAADSNSAPALADGSTVKSSSAVGVGVAVAIEIANAKTKAWVGGSSLHASGGVTVEAPMFHDSADVPDAYSAIAKPGSGNATKVSVAGALAVLIVTIERSALVNGGTVELNSGDLSLSSTSNSSSIAQAAMKDEVFNPTAVGAVASNEITLPYLLKHASGAELVSGDPVEYGNGGGQNIGGLTDGATYYVIVNASDHHKVKLAKSAADATAGSPVAIVLDGTKAKGKEHTLTPADVSHSKSFDPTDSGVVDTSTHEITLPSALTHLGGGALKTGDKVTYDAGETTPPSPVGANPVVNTAVGGLASGETYYVIVVDSTHVKLAASADDAKSDTPVHLSSGATGTNHKLTVTDEDTPSAGVGIGASVAINILTDTNTAGLANSATLAGAHNLTIAATTTEAMTTDAANGAAGGVAITPIAAIAISTVETYALIGSGGTSCGSNGGFLCLTGNLLATATQTVSSDTNAKGDTKGNSVAIGASLALNIGNHLVQATTKRNLDATGSVTFRAIGASATTSNAAASAAGADSGEDGGSPDTNNVNSKADGQLSNANSQSTANGGKASSADGGESSTPAADDSSGAKVSVAAAVAINLVHTTSDASLGQDLHIHAGGALTLQSKANTDAAATADGEASTSGGTATIGAAVAINLAKVKNMADLGPGSTVDSTDLTLSAIMNAAGSPSESKHSFSASATSGAGGGGTVTVAGSFALNIVDLSTSAMLRSSPTRGPPIVNSSHDVLLESASSLDSSTEALSAKKVFDPQSAVTGNTITLPSQLKHADGSEIKTGDAVLYSDGGDEVIGGLEDGSTYYVRVVSPGKIELFDTKDHATGASDSVHTGRKDLDKSKARGTEHSFVVGGSSEGAKVGIGASVSLNLVTVSTQAGLEADNSLVAPTHTITGAHDLTIHATDDSSLETKAEGGGGSAGVAVTVTVSITLVNITTGASIGSGADISVGGAIDAHATQTSATTTSAKGAVSGSNVGVGVSLALAIVTDNVDSSAARNLTAADAIGFVAEQSSANETTSAAAAKGAPKDDGEGDSSVNGKADKELTHANSSESGSTGKSSGKSSTPKASTGEADSAGSSSDDKASVSVAGAVSIAIIETHATAGFANGLTIHSTGGVITIKSAANTDSKTEAKGDTSTSASVGVGAGVIVNLVTIVNQASTGASSVHGTGLDVEAGMFGTDGDPIQHWTGTKWEAVSEGEWFPVTPTADQYFRLTAKFGANNPGVYKWNGSTWVAQTVAGDGADLPTSPSANELFRLYTHSISANADSGASNGDVGVAGSLALNIVHNHTEAFAPAGANLAGTSGPVTFKAQATLAIDASAHATVEDAENVGVGASISLNLLLDNIVRAEIVDGVPLAGGAAITVEALSAADVHTAVEAGTSGGTAITPAVALFVDLNDHTTARIGTSGTALSGSGALTIHASHSVDATTEGKGEAKSDGVAVGAVLTLVIVPSGEWTTNAELARDATVASAEITAESEFTAETTSLAAANGADPKKNQDDPSKPQEKSADDKKNATVDGNKNLEGKTSSSGMPSANDSATSKKSDSNSETGGSSGGSIGVAASISVNWIVTSNTAKISGGRNVHATSGGIKVSAQNTTVASAKATGISVSTSSDSSDARVGVAVGLNVADVTNSATIDNNSVIEANDITVEAVTPAGKHDDFVVWGMAAAGGKSDASIGASIGVQVVKYHSTAKIGTGSTITSHGDLTVQATSPLRVQDLALSAAFSQGGTAIGASIAVNVLDDIVTEAYIDSSFGHVTTVLADGAVKVDATASLGTITIDIPKPGGGNLFTTPGLSSVAIAGAASTDSDPAISGSFVVDVYFLQTHAWIADFAHVTGASVEVKAQDDTAITNITGALSFSSSGAGVGVGATVEIVNKNVRAWIGSSAVVTATAGDVTVHADATENLFELGVSGAGSGSSAAVDASIVVVVWNADSAYETKAEIRSGATVSASGKIEVEASDGLTLFLTTGAIAVSGGSAGVGASIAVVVRISTVEAVAAGASLTGGGGGVHVKASQTEDITIIVIAGGVGSSAGIAGAILVDVETNTTTATLSATSVHASGRVEVAASDDTTLKGIAGQLAVGGSAGVGVGVDIEVITKTTTAQIAPFTHVTTTSGGDVTVDASSSENVLSIAAGLSIGGSASVAVNAGVSVYTITTNATIGDHANVNADGSVRVSADEALTLDIIAGNVAVGGAAGIGVAAVVPVLTKHTNALIDHDATVIGKGNGSGLTVNTGAYTVTSTDMRFNGAHVSGNQINTGIDLGFQTGDMVTYDAGDGAPIGTPTTVDAPDGHLVANHVYFIIRDDATHVRLADSKAHATSGTALALTPGSGESHRLIGTQQAQPQNDKSQRFDPGTDVDNGAHTITLPYALALHTDDPVVYGAGGGAPINGLVDGNTYYVIGDTTGPFQLAASKGGSAIPITNSGTTGRSHSIVKQGEMPSASATDSAPHVVAPGTSTGFKGVAVTATNSDDVNSVAVVAAVGGSAGVGVGGTVNIITVDTNATIGNNATVNDPSGDNAAQSVLVAAGNQFHLLLVSVTVAVGGGAGVGGSVNVAVLSLHATALIDDNATVYAEKDVVVSATQSETLVAITFAAAGGTVGVAGAVGVIVLGTQTWAKTGGGVSITAGNNVAFLAQDTTKITGITGGAAGGFVGVGVGVYVLVLTKDTESTVESTSLVTANANTTDGLSGISNGTVSDGGFGFATFRGAAIQASSSEDIFGIVVSLGAGFVGVAVPVGVTLLNVTTQATLAGTVWSGRDVNISALDKMKTITIAGGVGAGFVGVGAGVDIGVANNSSAAVIAATGSVTHARNVDVNALSWKKVTTYTFAVGGGAVGVGGAVSIWSVGTSPTSSYDDGNGDTGNGRSELGSGAGDPASSADAQVSGNQTDGSGHGTGYQSILDGTQPSSTPSDGTANKAQTRINNGSSSSKSTIVAKGNAMGTPSQTALSTPINRGTSAELFGHVTATGNVTVRADDNVGFGGIVGAAGGGAVGIGASILVGSIDAETTAEVGGGAIISAGGQVLVYAGLQENTSTLAFAGGVGAVGVGAQVSVLNDSSSQWAKIDNGAHINQALAGIDVKAENNNRSVKALTIGGAFGGVAAGVAIGVVNLTGSTKATVGNAIIGSGGTVSSLTVEAHDNSTATTEAIAVAAGIGIALSGSVAFSHVHPSEVTASISGGATITVTGALNVNADAKPNVTAEAFGIAVAGGAGLGISLAFATNNVTVHASIGDGSHFNAGSISVGAALDEPAGLHAHNAYASSVAGGGGILLGASGALSYATTSGSVSASIGNNTFLPNGDVTVAAYGRSLTQADATGVAVGFIGIGAAIANSTTSVATSASLGSNASTSSTRNGDLTIESWGLGYTVAASTAGSGGVISGNASVGNTTDNSSASTSIGFTTNPLYAHGISITSQNDSNYYTHSDSTNAAVVGAAGAFAEFDGNTSSTTTLPNSLTLNATGVVEISSQNNFFSANGGSFSEPDDNVDAAGGGGISLTAASSSTKVTSHSTVNIGTNLTINAVNQPESNLASIGIDAGTQLLSNDFVTLSTGGAIDGAGVSSDLTGHIFSAVNIGNNANLYSTQNIGIGTYTIVVGHLEADSSTWGLAAVGFADSHMSVDSHESINVGSGANLFGLGNVNVRAGDDSTGGLQTSLTGSTSAQSYVRGLIAIPSADASTHFDSTQSTTLSGVTIRNGRNTTIGANPHTPFASADGTGHGYELGFIPITDGSSDPQVNTTANVTVNGSVIAGFYYLLTLTIANTGSAGGFFSGVNAITQNADSAPVTATYDSSFNPRNFVNGAPGGDITNNAILVQYLQTGTVGAIHLGNVFAAAGNVIIDAKNAFGSASLTAHGGPRITIDNQSADYLILDGTAIIPFSTGGHVAFEGGATKPGSMSKSENDVDVGGTISIHNSFGGTYGTPDTGPGMIIAGELSNLGGLVDLVNDQGSIVVTAPFYAAQVSISAPNGAFALTVIGTAVLGSAPMSDWDNVLLFPGGNPHTILTLSDLNPNVAIEYAADSQHPGYASVGDLMYALIGNKDTTNRDVNLSGGDSIVYLGDCFPLVSGNCDGNANNGISPIGSAHDWGKGQFFANIDSSLALTFSRDYGASSTSTTGDPAGTGPQSAIIAGSAVLISAGAVDLNTHIEVGPPTDWSASLPSNLVVPVFGGLLHVSLATYRDMWLHGLVSNPVVDLPVNAVNPGDTLITASYDARTGQITVNKVRASSGSAIVRIRGQLVSTNALGQIKINGGLGHVSVDNQTGAPLVVQDIYAGSNASADSSTSIVDLLDTNTNVQTMYTFRPGAGITVYTGSLSATMDNLRLGASTHVDGTTTNFDPQAGWRLEWQLQAQLTRVVTVSGESIHAENWIFTVPDNPNNPWQFYNWTTGQYQSADLPDSSLVYAPGNPNAFTETISGTSNYGAEERVCYENYGDIANNVRNDQCASDTTYPMDQLVSLHGYRYPTTASVTLNMSVKADNPVQILFGGHDRGLISINSSSDVYLVGDLTNPNGDTTITSTGKITQAPDASILTNNLTLSSSGGGVGTPTNPIQATLTPGGVLNGGSSSAGFFLDLQSGATIGTVTAGGGTTWGDIRIRANGSILGQNVATNVSGRDLTLTTAVGSIGTGAHSLQITAHTTSLGSGGFNHGALYASAPGDIMIHQISGDLAIDHVISSAGDVVIDVTGGGIFDLRGQTPAQTISDADATALWTRLQLTSALGAQAREDATVTEYETQVNRNYFQYFQLLGVGTVVAGQYLLNDAKVGAYRLQAKAQLCAVATQNSLPCAAGDPTDQQVKDYAASLYTTSVAFLQNAFGASYAATIATFDPLFAYHVTPGSQQDQDLRKNGLWTENELRYAINRRALTAATGGSSPVVTTVSGHNVTLTATGSIGRAAGSVVITLAQLNSGALTDEQIGALTTAVAPGSITIHATVNGVDSHFNLATAPIDCAQDPSNPSCKTIVALDVSIAENAPVYFAMSPGGVFTAHAGGNAYLYSTAPDVKIAQVTAGGNATLTVPQNISSTGALVPAVQTGGDLTIAAVNGDMVGSGPTTALVIRVGGILRGAVAGGTLRLLEDTGNLTYDLIQSGADSTVTVSAGSLLQHSTGVGILASTLTLDAFHAIGTLGQPVTTQIDPAGTLTATANDSIWIHAANGDLNVRDVLSRNGDVWLESDQSILDAVDVANPSNPSAGNSTSTDPTQPNANVVAHNVTLITLNGQIGQLGNDFDINSNGLVSSSSSGGDTRLIETSGDLVLSTVATSGAGTETVYLKTLSGDIVNGNNAVINVTAPNFWFQASGSVGSGAHSLKTAVGHIVGRAVGGSILIDQFGAVTIGGVLDNAGNAVPAGLQAATSITFTAHSPITIAADVIAGGAIVITSVDSLADDSIAVSTPVTVRGASVTILAGDNLTLAPSTTIQSTTGAVVLTADAGKVDGTNAFIAADNATISAATSFSATATGDVSLTNSTAGAGTSLALTSTAGSINVTLTNLTAGSTLTGSAFFDLMLLASGLISGSSTSLTAGNGFTAGSTTIGAGTSVTITATAADLDLFSTSIDAVTFVTGLAHGTVEIRGSPIHAGSFISFTASLGDVLADTGSSFTATTGSITITATLGDGHLLTGATLTAILASITVQAGHNLNFDQTTTLTAATTITVNGDIDNLADPSGTAILLQGTLVAPLITVNGNDNPDTITLQPRGSSFVYGRVEINGRGASDVITVDRMTTLDLTRKFYDGVGATPAALDTGHSSATTTTVRYTVNIDGGAAADQVTVDLTGTTDYIVNVHDTGNPGDGADVLTINGTTGDDTFLMRAQFVALMQPGASASSFGPDYERINYDTTTNVLQVNGGDGNDTFYVDDNSAITTIDGGAGADTFQFGQMFGAARDIPSVAPGDEIATVQTTVGYLTRGISFSTVVYAGDGNDQLTVFSNKASLKLFGEDGNDTFIVRAFLLVGGGTATSDTTLSGGAGDDHIEYNINAPVSIDGGAGVDTVVVIGTEASDNFVITQDGVMGAGLFIKYTAVERVEVDGLEGDDHFFVLSTNPNVVTTIVGGLGSDTVDVGGDVTGTIVALDTEGTSGFINHSISSTDPAYDGIFAEGVRLNVAGSDIGTVVSQLIGSSQIVENGTGGTDTTTYELYLASTPATATVAYLTLSAALDPSKYLALGGGLVQISVDGGAWTTSTVLTLDSTNASWTHHYIVSVRAVGDGVAEGPLTAVISASIQSSNVA